MNPTEMSSAQIAEIHDLIAAAPSASEAQTDVIIALDRMGINPHDFQAFMSEIDGNLGAQAVGAVSEDLSLLAGAYNGMISEVERIRDDNRQNISLTGLSSQQIDELQSIISTAETPLAAQTALTSALHDFGINPDEFSQKMQEFGANLGTQVAGVIPQNLSLLADSYLDMKDEIQDGRGGQDQIVGISTADRADGGSRGDDLKEPAAAGGSDAGKSDEPEKDEREQTAEREQTVASDGPGLVEQAAAAAESGLEIAGAAAVDAGEAVAANHAQRQQEALADIEHEAGRRQEGQAAAAAVASEGPAVAAAIAAASAPEAALSDAQAAGAAAEAAQQQAAAEQLIDLENAATPAPPQQPERPGLMAGISNGIGEFVNGAQQVATEAGQAAGAAAEQAAAAAGEYAAASAPEAALSDALAAGAAAEAAVAANSPGVQEHPLVAAAAEAGRTGNTVGAFDRMGEHAGMTLAEIQTALENPELATAVRTAFNDNMPEGVRNPGFMSNEHMAGLLGADIRTQGTAVAEAPEAPQVDEVSGLPDDTHVAPPVAVQEGAFAQLLSQGQAAPIGNGNPLAQAGEQPEQTQVASAEPGAGGSFQTGIPEAAEQSASGPQPVEISALREWTERGNMIGAGMSGEHVSELQAFLREHTDPNLNISGVMDPPSVAALQEFQRDNGLQADGIVGPNTMNEIAQENMGAVMANNPALRLVTQQAVGGLSFTGQSPEPLATGVDTEELAAAAAATPDAREVAAAGAAR